MLQPSISLAAFLALASTCFLTAPSSVRAEWGDRPVVKPETCADAGVTVRIFGLERMSPGTMTLRIEFESSANFPQRLRLGRETMLVDDTGFEWRTGEQRSSDAKTLLPDVRSREEYTFTRTLSGRGATSAALLLEFQAVVFSDGERARPQRTARSGRCKLLINGVPITDSKGK